ncbi:ATP-binding response regulator [Candidatus Magnetomonas plexicatena]|uniref:ATP-binding response regulator n=1 Tax=Candidatus Magnetomonas plexicatena TaxID=2552947 RepID=UPI001104DB89|nr:hybrid sensor histidine kinase/response regulator [Nitrospirales bacterium LBB_01]
MNIEQRKLLKLVSVLYVEDQPDTREELADILSMDVGTLYVAEDGVQGLQLFQEHKPDIVVTDIQMPKMDGLTMAKSIKDIDENVPVIVLTAFNEPRYLIQSIDIGIDSYATKPTNPDKLLETIYKSAVTIFQRREIEKKTDSMRFILDSNPSFMMTMDGDEVEYINKTFLKFLGFETLDKFKKSGINLYSLITKINDEAPDSNSEKSWLSAIVNASEKEHVIYLKEHGSDTRPFIATTGKFSLSYYIITLTEIAAIEAERGKLKDDAAKAKKLLEVQSRAAQMGELINAIAHQWKQPLNILALIIQDMENPELDGEPYKDYVIDLVNDGMSQISYMSKTIDDFRDFFKPSKEKKLFYPLAAINNAIEIIGKQYKINDITITVTGNERATVRGYQNEFKQTIINLLNNTRDAFVSNKIQNRKVDITVKDNGTKTTITIQDNAGGIPAHILPTIFDPYVSTKGANGTGIGLSISKTIIEDNMGGSLTADNADDGALFTIELPAENLI